MMSFNQIMRWSWAFLVAVTLSLGLAGCEGDDGAPGAAGAAGAAGADGADGLACWDLNGDGVGNLPDEDLNNDGVVNVADCSAATAKVTPLESCGVCHSEGSFADAAEFHALDPIETYGNVALAVNGLDLDVTFDLQADGVAATGYDTLERGYRNDGAVRTDICNRTNGVCDPASLTLTESLTTPGNYTIKVLGGAAQAATDNRYLFRVSAGGERETRLYLYGDFPASPVEDLAISAEACNACHGPEGIDVHGGYFAKEDGGEPCLTCHGAGTIPRLFEVAHEYHSGLRDPITFPTYMNNCSVCHAEEAQLAAANAMDVSAEHCFSCHGSIASWDFTGLSFSHAGVDETTDCQICHAPDNGLGAPVTVAEAHNGFVLDNDGILWNGEDTSVTEGAKFIWQIDNVADDGTNLAVTWSASYDGAPVNVCNATVAAGAPVFHDGGVDEDGDPICRLRIYRSYAQGEDFIMGTSTSGTGQPGRANVCVANTTCVDGVATTTIPVDAIAAERGRLALNGKPLVVSVADPAGTMVARAKTPTFDWLVGIGGAAPDRRSVVDTTKCVGCHVGSLYQHGGDRVDNVNTCLVCHNAAANEKYRRVAMGVDASEAYDGKAGEAFELKTLVHRVHSANFDWDPLPDDRSTPDVVENVKYNPPYLVYRSRGIYAFANDPSAVPNWDVISTEGCTEDEIARGERLVFGGDPESSTSCQPHNFHAPTFPRSINECTACHVEGFGIIPDQTEAMANTVDPGSDTWENQLDDVLQGAAATACVTCHADGASKGHAYQNSWTPQVFPEGRQTIIDAVN